MAGAGFDDYQDYDDVGRPDPERRLGRIVIAILALGFLVAALVRMDAAVYAEGQVVVAGQRQDVQHREGGVVGALHVREGQSVREGQMLIRLAAADVEARERALAEQVTRLLARRSRLEAEVQGLADVPPPAEFEDLSVADGEIARLILLQERAELRARAAQLRAETGALSQRAAGVGDQQQGIGSLTTSAREQLRLIDEEIELLRPLAERGFVSKTRLRALERAAADLRGQQGQFAAAQGQASREVSDLRLQREAAVAAFRARAATELGATLRQLAESQPQLHFARDQLSRIDIRAPATGIVIGLNAATVGGVIAPGQKLMEIVPDGEVRINARISPADADDLKAGQDVQVRLSGIHEAGLPSLKGRVVRISADSFTDEYTAQTYFAAEIELAEDQLAIVRRVRAGFELRPGMPVEMVVPLRSRSALSYLVEPLFGTFWRSFREQ